MVPKQHRRRSTRRTDLPRRGDADGGVRVEDVAIAASVHVGDRRKDLLVRYGGRVHVGARGGDEVIGRGEVAARFKVVHQRLHLSRVVATHVEEKALKVGGDTNVRMSRKSTKIATITPVLLIRSISVIFTAFAERTRNITDILKYIYVS